jgi:nitroimidazol reductase NimA-like FMN-containing flavoprotein (pyridoxamine 5'-phosphate oxidase superfamily)
MMSRAGSGTSRRFQELDWQQCYQLLATQELARVAWQAADTLQILPVNYALFEAAIYFRTSPYSPMSKLARPTDVAVEVDEVDRERHTGWSVVVHGRSGSVGPLDDPRQRWALDSLMPWAAGLRTLLVRVVPLEISGRLLRRYVDL